MQTNASLALSQPILDKTDACITREVTSEEKKEQTPEICLLMTSFLLLIVVLRRLQ
jgi:hypothetical protein